MKGPQFNRLVENIRRDGCLTSLPTVNRQDGVLVVVSGNHRVSAAIKAGIEEADCIEVTTPLSREQFVALQLSHNAIVGQDDPNILRSLYDELDFAWKEYSGLTDDAFNIADLDISALNVHAPFYEELRVSFLPGDREIFTGWLEKLGKATDAERFVGRYEDFTNFFDTLMAVKQSTNIHNGAVALRMMAELAGEMLAQKEKTTGKTLAGKSLATAEKETDARTQANGDGSQADPEQSRPAPAEPQRGKAAPRRAKAA